MKTIPFVGLNSSQKRHAERRVSEVLVKMARESGRVCVEDSKSVAERAAYSMTRGGWIWGFTLPEDVRWAVTEGGR